jgi:hypothetical protein
MQDLHEIPGAFGPHRWARRQSRSAVQRLAIYSSVGTTDAPYLARARPSTGPRLKPSKLGVEVTSTGPHQSSVSRGQIVDDLADICVLDRRAIDLDHLGHLRLPESFLVLYRRLRGDVISRVTGRAIALDDLEIGAGPEGGSLV